MKRSEAAYVNGVRMFSGFARRVISTSCLVLCRLGLPTFSTMLYNAQFSLNSSVKFHTNASVTLNKEICVVNRSYIGTLTMRKAVVKTLIESQVTVLIC